MSKFPLFNGLTEAEVQSIVEHPECEQILFKANSTIYSADQFRHAIGVILSGKAVAKNGDDSGVIVRCLSKGDCFGVAAVFVHNGKPYVSNITAKTDCTVLFIPESVISVCLTQYKNFAVNYVSFLTGRIQYLNRLVSAYSSPNVETKLARFISAYVDGEAVPFDLNMTSLSKSLGIGRASLYRALDSLESNGVIKRDSKRIIITDIKKIKQY